MSNFATKIYFLLLQIELRLGTDFYHSFGKSGDQHLKVKSREGVAPSCTPEVAAEEKRAFELPRPICYFEAYPESTHLRRITLNYLKEKKKFIYKAEVNIREVDFFNSVPTCSQNTYR